MSRTVFMLRRGSARDVKADRPAGICSAAAFRKALSLERARAVFAAVKRTLEA